MAVWLGGAPFWLTFVLVLILLAMVDFERRARQRRLVALDVERKRRLTVQRLREDFRLYASEIAGGADPHVGAIYLGAILMHRDIVRALEGRGPLARD